MDNPTAYFENIFKQNPKHLDLSDGTLLTEDGYSFRIHKFALAKCSEYFSALFCGMGMGNKDYLIPGIRGEILSNILTFLYTQQIDITERNICGIIVASDYLLLDDLVSRIKSFLTKNLSVANCLDIHECLWQINKKDLLRESYRYIQINFEQVLFNMDERFSQLSLECLKNLLNDSNLRVQNETAVWKAILNWVTADTANRLARVPGLLMYIRIVGVHENLAKEILTHAIVARNTFCKLIYFTSKTTWRNILKLHQCHVWNDTQFCTFFVPRKPSCLNFIVKCSDRDETEIYVTYDENVDLWRKIIQVDRRLHYFTLVSLGDCIYLLNKYVKTFNWRYNVIEKQWIEFQDMRVERNCYVALSLGGFLYILGGWSRIGGTLRQIYDVEIYDPEENAWHDTTPMLPITNHISAVTLNDCIYVLGTNTMNTEMSAQMYNPSTGIWIEIPKPSRFYDSVLFSLIAYNEKIYIFGRVTCDDENPDSKVVYAEVFDPMDNVWHFMPSLPQSYGDSRGLVINNRLFVSEKSEFGEDCEFKPPVYWNNEQECWESIADSSPLFQIHEYFFTVQEGDRINVISKENKMPTAVFEKSPFS